MSKCCFCGKEIEYKVNGNDPRPIRVKGEEMPICCNECNARIVVPTRVAVWGMEKELKEKLAEKEKELIGRKKLCDLRYEQLKQAHQDKINFAVEQLLQVKEKILSNTTFGIESVEIMNSIDKQIEELKKEMK